MILYRITKERAAKRWPYTTGEYYSDKHEVIITVSKGRVTQCLKAAERSNQYYERAGQGHKYRCLVQTLEVPDDTPFEFWKEVPYPE
jgi:hypothetical protein